MSSEAQTIAALVITAAAAVWLVVRLFQKNKSACARDCGCPSNKFKGGLKNDRRR
ncbi:MAG: FeoB-associated Cys-rich membrane protein [Opitutaceae bacterium]|jgi:hypothetical protein|nr:FeoB-associated Cys-rich membrane protein [Opitutaceae bacterium]